MKMNIIDILFVVLIAALLPSFSYGSSFAEVSVEEPSSPKPRIVVVGCGFAGLELSNVKLYFNTI